MSFTAQETVYVRIVKDRPMALGFQFWLSTKNGGYGEKGIFSIPTLGSVSGDSYHGVFDIEHKKAINEFFASCTREDCPNPACTRSHACPRCFGPGVVIKWPGYEAWADKEAAKERKLAR